VSKITIDIIGYVKGSLGIGEQVRSVIRIALLAGYKVNLFDLASLNTNANFSNNNNEFDHLITNTFVGQVRIFSAPLDNIASCFFNSEKKDFLDFSKNIFHIAWEFSSLPPILNNFLNLGNEIWTISDFITLGVRNDMLAPSLPTKTFPNSLYLPKNIEIKTKKDFNLPDKFIFYSTFDANSSYIRKNLFGTIDSFLKAFKNNDKCILLIKVSYLSSPIYNDLKNVLYTKVEDFKNIVIIDQPFSRDSSLSLLNSCDAYISLHRSEGFGLNILEAMALSKPVIVTGYSGNMDFCFEDSSFLVDYKLIPVSNSEYHYAQGLEWAEPDIGSAAKMIERVFFNKAEVISKTLRAKNYIEENYTPLSLVPKFKDYIAHII
jgi:glycosyltransferase involved in cell wall biosynthesis